MEEKEYAGSYRIEQMLRFGKKYFVLGLDDRAEEKYLLAERHTNHDTPLSAIARLQRDCIIEQEVGAFQTPC